VLAHRVISRAHNNQVAFREKRTSTGRQSRLVWSRMTQTGHHCVVETTLRCDFLSTKCAEIEGQSLSYVTRGRSLRFGRLCNDPLQPRDVFQEAPTGQDEEVVPELRVLKVDFK
jgi:hypothetical protein